MKYLYAFLMVVGILLLSACEVDGVLFVDFTVDSITICIGQSFDVSDILTNKNCCVNYTISNENILLMENNIITANEVGETEIKVSSLETLAKDHTDSVRVNVVLNKDCIVVNSQSLMLEVGEDFKISNQVTFKDEIKECDLEWIYSDIYFSFNDENNSLKALKTGSGVITLNAKKDGKLYATTNINFSIIERNYVESIQLNALENNIFFTNSTGKIDYEIFPENADEYYFQCDSSLLKIDTYGNYEIYDLTGTATINIVYKISKSQSSNISFPIVINYPIEAKNIEISNEDSVVCKNLIYGNNYRYFMNIMLSDDLLCYNVSFSNISVNDLIVEDKNVTFNFICDNGKDIILNYSAGYNNYYKNTITICSDCFVDYKSIDFLFSYLEMEVSMINNAYNIFLLNDLQNWQLQKYPTWLGFNVYENNNKLKNVTISFYKETSKTDELFFLDGIIFSSNNIGSYTMKVSLFDQIFEFCIIVQKVLVDDFSVKYNSLLELNSANNYSTALLLIYSPSCAYDYNEYTIFNNSADYLSIVKNDDEIYEVSIIAVGDNSGVTINFAGVSKTIDFELDYCITDVVMLFDNVAILKNENYYVDKAYMVTFEVYSGKKVVNNLMVSYSFEIDGEYNLYPARQINILEISNEGNIIFIISAKNYSKQLYLNFICV